MAETLTNKVASNLQLIAEKVQKYEENNIQEIQKETLLALYEIKDSLEEEIKDVEKLNYRVDFMGNKLHQSIFEDKEKEALVQENQKLKKSKIRKNVDMKSGKNLMIYHFYVNP